MRSITVLSAGLVLAMLACTSEQTPTEPDTPGETRAAPQWDHDTVVRVTLDGRPHLLAVGGTHGPNFDIPNESELYTP